MSSPCSLTGIARYPIVCLLLMLGTQAAARDKPDHWLEVQSPHFLLIANGNEKQARKVADQFERIRSVFQKAFPGLRVDPSAPIIVLAARDEKTFNTLAPESWLQKGRLKRTGLFLRGPEKNYVLLRMNAEGDNPYHVLYHEYTHLLVHESLRSIPLWLDEGLAEFYGNSEIQEKDVLLGRPIEGHIVLLRESKLLSLSTLFAVDYSSPYYNEENKGSIFYAESWALTHYLLLNASQGGKNPLFDFINLLAKNVDAKAAALSAFGDTAQLEKNLKGYVQQSSFKYILVKGSTEVDEDEFKVRELSPADSAALRGDFLVYNQRYDDARDLLREALLDDPNNAQAAESMGFLEFRQRHTAESKKWFTQAVKLNSQSYLAHYYFAVMTLQQTATGPDAALVESSLRSAIKINPRFAPAYDALGVFYGKRGERLEEARLLGVQAVQLEPGNIRYRLNVANILLQMKRTDDAVNVAKMALSMARTSEEISAAQSFLDSAQKYQEYLAAVKKNREQADAAASEAQRQLNQQANSDQNEQPAISGVENDQDTAPPRLRHRDEGAQGSREANANNTAPALGHRAPVARGARDLADGKIVSVKCSSPGLMDLTFQTSVHSIELHSENYYSVQYSALNFTPSGELLPCIQLQGMKARIFFYDIKGQTYSGEIISVQLRK